MHDVGIVGAGPAGLNAALVLARCGRDLVIFDSGQPRNGASQGLHGYLTRNGVAPLDLRALGQREVLAYPTVRLQDTEIVSAARRNAGFDLIAADGEKTSCRMLLLATGRVDVLPDRPGFREYYGRGVYHCPYCDGWEHRGQRIVVYGESPGVVELALELLTWSKHLTVAAPNSIDDVDRARLEANGIAVAGSDLTEIGGGNRKRLEFAVLRDGTRLQCDALFFESALPQRSPLAQSLGCQLDPFGSVICTQHAATGVPGLYVAGNVRGGVHMAIMAAAEGAEAAIAINDALAERELRG